MHTCKEPAAKLILTLNFKVKKFFLFIYFFFWFVSITKIKLSQGNIHESQPNGFLEKWGKGWTRSSSDFSTRVYIITFIFPTMSCS